MHKDYHSSKNIPHLHRVWIDAQVDRLENIISPLNPYRGSIRPCGKGTIGLAPIKELSASDRKYENDSRTVRGVEYLDMSEDGFEYLETSTYVSQVKGIMPDPLPCQESRPVAQEKRVAAGLTKLATKNIEDGCLLLERRYPLNYLGFFTLTLSLQTEEEIRSFNEVAATCLKRFLEKMKRLYAKRNSKFLYIGVWECHPCRRGGHSTPVLHFHYISPCRSTGKKGYVASSDEIRSLWTASVRTSTGHMDASPCRVGTEVLRKSCAGYLSKYFSKGGNSGREPDTSNEGIELSSWYSVSRNLLHCIRACTLSVGQFAGGSGRTSDIQAFLNKFTVSHGVVTKWVGEQLVPVCHWFIVKPFLKELLSVIAGENVAKFL